MSLYRYAHLTMGSSGFAHFSHLSKVLFHISTEEPESNLLLTQSKSVSARNLCDHFAEAQFILNKCSGKRSAKQHQNQRCECSAKGKVNFGAKCSNYLGLDVGYSIQQYLSYWYSVFMATRSKCSNYAKKWTPKRLSYSFGPRKHRTSWCQRTKTTTKHAQKSVIYCTFLRIGWILHWIPSFDRSHEFQFCGRFSIYSQQSQVSRREENCLYKKTEWFSRKKVESK